MRFTLREALLALTAICLSLGCYSLGIQHGERRGHLHGYAEAEDHYQVMLSSYAERRDVWEHIGDLWREYPNMTIIGDPLDSDEEWQAYVQYHAQRNGWKSAAVFTKLPEAERLYRKEIARREKGAGRE